jgi:tetratricopeptide (TPR) repeat protein
MSPPNEQTDQGTQQNDLVSVANDMLRSLSTRSEAVKPFVPSIGGPRLYLLLLYASIVIGSSIDFFLGKEYWYGNWDVYNSYVFVVSGIFVLIGIYMLLTIKGAAAEDEFTLPFPLTKQNLGLLGMLLFAGSALALVAWGSAMGSWAAVPSILLVSGFILVVLGSKGISGKDGLWLSLFGIGFVLMLIVPVHEAFNIGRTSDGEILSSPGNVIMFVIGMTMCLVSTVAFRTRDGLLGAWLIGAMGILLVSFHEQLGIFSSNSYEPYDRVVALIGVAFSFLPLVVYLWREIDYMAIWSDLRAASSMVEAKDYEGALKSADASLQRTAKAGISQKFALPWTLKADAYYRMKKYSKAKTNYDISLDIDPNDSVSWCIVGNMHALEGKRALALTAYDRAISADPKNYFAWNNKGVVFNSLSWPEEALSCFEKSLMINPENYDAHLNLGKELAKLKRSDEAVAHFQKALELKRDSVAARDGLHTEFMRGQYLDQINGWEQLGLDTTFLKSFLERDMWDFERKTKEFLSGIVEQRTQLTIGTGEAKVDVNAAIKTILDVTADEGATLDHIMKTTNLTRDQLVLPLALLMKTDHVHFKKSGTHDMYVSKGKAPSEPVLPPQPPPEQPPAEQKPKEKEKKKEREKPDKFEPTASVLVFRSKKKKKRRE